MKKIAVIFLLIIIKQAVSQPDSLYQLLEQANKFYNQKNYNQAIENYKKIINSGYVSSELYYNLANAYYKTGQIPYAILYYEKSLLLNPHNKKAKENLNFIYSQLPQIAQKSKEFIIDKIYRDTYTLLTSNQWAIISIVSFLIALILGLLFYLSNRINVRRIGFILGIIMLLLSAVSLLFSVEMKNYQKGGQYGIVMEISSVKSSPSEEGTELFIVQPGMKVKILDSEDQWLEVKLPNNKIGWIEKIKIEKI